MLHTVLFGRTATLWRLAFRHGFPRHSIRFPHIYSGTRWAQNHIHSGRTRVTDCCFLFVQDEQAGRGHQFCIPMRRHSWSHVRACRGHSARTVIVPKLAVLSAGYYSYTYTIYVLNLDPDTKFSILLQGRIVTLPRFLILPKNKYKKNTGTKFSSKFG